MSQASSEIQVHSTHFVLFGVWALTFAVAYIRGRRHSNRTGPTPPTRYPDGRACLVSWPASIAACSLVAAGVHLDVISQHFRESVWYGSFFVGLAAAQLTFAACVLMRPSRALIKAGAVASLGVVLLWAATRTTGIPLGPVAGKVEAVSVLDMGATSAELISVLGCALALRRGRSARYLNGIRWTEATNPLAASSNKSSWSEVLPGYGDRADTLASRSIRPAPIPSGDKN